MEASVVDLARATAIELLSQTNTPVCSPCHIGQSECQFGAAAQVKRRQAVMSVQRERGSSLDVSLCNRPLGQSESRQLRCGSSCIGPTHLPCLSHNLFRPDVDIATLQALIGWLHVCAELWAQVGCGNGASSKSSDSYPSF